MLRQHRPPGLLTEIAFAGVPGDCKRQTGTGQDAVRSTIESKSALLARGSMPAVS